MRDVATKAVLTGLLLVLAGCGPKETTAPKTAEAPAAPKAAAPTGMPTPKAGLWEYAISGTDTPEQTMTMCLDKATAEKSLAGSPVPSDTCSENSYKRNGDGTISFKTVCDMGSGGVQTNTGVIKGDMNSDYTVTYSTVTTGSQVAAMNRTIDGLSRAHWAGACPEGAKPGDIHLPNGMTLNMNAGAAK